MNDRQQKIMELLDDNGFVTVEFLSKTLYCSGATIRRDLAALAESQKIKRTHGGAMHFSGISNDFPFTFATTVISMKNIILQILQFKIFMTQ